MTGDNINLPTMKILSLIIRDSFFCAGSVHSLTHQALLTAPGPAAVHCYLTPGEPCLCLRTSPIYWCEETEVHCLICSCLNSLMNTHMHTHWCVGVWVLNSNCALVQGEVHWVFLYNSREQSSLGILHEHGWEGTIPACPLLRLKLILSVKPVSLSCKHDPSHVPQMPNTNMSWVIKHL